MARGDEVGVHYYGDTGALSPRNIIPYYEYSLNFFITVLVFWAKIKKSATLYGDLLYWCLNTFSQIQKSIIST